MMSPIRILDSITINSILYYEITDEAARNIKPKTFYISPFGEIYNVESGFFQPKFNSGEYIGVSLTTTHSDRKIYLLHRLLMITFKYIPNYKYLMINHINGNKHDNRLENLEWASVQRNTEHALLNNMIYTGEKCPWAILTEKDVREICQLLASKTITITDIAKRYNCSITTVGDIARGKTWKDVSKDYNLDYDLRDRFLDNEVHTICKIFAANKGKSFEYLYYLVIFMMGYPDEKRIKRRISKLYYRNPANYYDITSQYDY